MEPIYQISTKCENVYCKGILNDHVDYEFSDECGVCYDSLEGQEMVALSNCDHAFCSSCLSNFREDKRLFKCPYCSGTSYSTIKTKKYIKGEQRIKIFKEHLKCYESDPNVAAFFENLSPIWREFIEKVLLAEVGDYNPFWNKQYESIFGLTRINGVNRYNICRVEGEESMRLNINCSLPGAVIQFMLSTEDFIYDEVDNDHADRFISWLNRQYDESWAVVPNFQDQHDIDYFMWRRFEKIHCAMNLLYDTPVPKCDGSEVVVENDFDLFLAHNFKNLPFSRIRDPGKVFDEETAYLIKIGTCLFPALDFAEF